MTIGRDVIYAIGASSGSESAVALSTECTLREKSDMIETTGPSTGSSKAFRAGRLSWTISGMHYSNGANWAVIEGYFHNRTLLSVLFTMGSYSRRGTAYISDLTSKGEVKGLAQFQMTLTGTGALSNVSSS